MNGSLEGGQQFWPGAEIIYVEDIIRRECVKLSSLRSVSDSYKRNKMRRLANHYNFEGPPILLPITVTLCKPRWGDGFRRHV